MAKKFEPTQQELKLITRAAESDFQDVSTTIDFLGDDDFESYEDESLTAGDLIRIVSRIASDGEFDNLCDFTHEFASILNYYMGESQELLQMLVIAYKMGIAEKHSGCMNNLGAMYYSGNGLEQDYEKAAELYEMASDAGSHQATVNLGYIWEYGRCGEQSLEKAFGCYSYAAVLGDSIEAKYKLGDLYNKGVFGEKNIKKAFFLWAEAFNSTDNNAERSQPALRMANVIIDEKLCKEVGQPCDPLLALHLYQIAEFGLRVDIRDGLTYYKKRLKEALEGQKRARKALAAEDVLD